MSNNYEQTHYLRRITPQQVEQFITDKATTGGIHNQNASIKTLKGYLSAINKVMACSNNWLMSDRLSLRSFKRLDLTSQRQQTVYKPLIDSEWIERNPNTYAKYQQAIDTMRAFVLRSRKLATLNSKSFLQDPQTGNYYVLKRQINLDS